MPTGDARNNWTSLRVEALLRDGKLQIGDGYRAKNLEMGPRGLPFARVENIRQGIHLDGADLLDESNIHKVGQKISKPGDIVFTSKGSVGRFALVTSETLPFVYSPQLSYWRIVDRSLLDPVYLYYWMNSEDFRTQVNRVKGLTDMADYVNLADQRRMEIVAPALSHQRRIASILSAYDDLIENNTRRIKILEEMAQAIYREWFVEFRAPGVELRKASPEEKKLTGKDLFPKGWEVKNYTDVIDVLSGGTPKTEVQEYWGGDIPWFSPRDLTDSIFILDTTRKITQLGLSKCNSKLYAADTVFITARGTVGRCVLAGVPMAMSQTSYALRWKGNGNQFFVFQLTLGLVALFKKQAIGAVFDTIVIDNFRRQDIVVPAPKLLESFDEIIHPIFANIKALMQKNINLRRTRDLLLPKLISGEVSVETMKS